MNEGLQALFAPDCVVLQQAGKNFFLAACMEPPGPATLLLI